MTEKSPLDWPKLVPACQYAYNLSVHKALKNSPYSTLFGVDPNTPLNNKGFVSQPIYGEEYQDNMGNRLKAARQLAKKNNMNFRNDYVKRFNSKVDPHNFQEGQLVYLHRPELIKINPKLQSEWFGPFVILSKIGESNCLIQDLANRKTKFVNSNRLRAFNLTIDDWKKFKLTLTKDFVNKDTAEMQSTKQTEKITNSATEYALFDKDNEIVLLNPEVTPVPKVLKLEPSDTEDIVPIEEPVENVQAEEHEAFGKFAHELVKSPKVKSKPKPSTSGILTCTKALKRGETVPSVRKQIEKQTKSKK